MKIDYTAIDFATYKRRDHYTHFLQMDNPFVTMTCDIDITNYLNNAKKNNYPFFLYFQYAVVNVANRIKELKQRIKKGKIVEFEHCDASYIVSKEDGTYRYCNVCCNTDLNNYINCAKEKEKQAINEDHLIEEGDPDQYFYITCMPWVSYKSLNFPISNNKFSVPSFGWGKYYKENYIDEDGSVKQRYKMPVTIMVNHALVDGKQICDFFNLLQEEVNL